MSSGLDILNGAPMKLLTSSYHSLFHKVSTFCMQFGPHSHTFRESSPVSYRPFTSKRYVGFTTMALGRV